MLGDGAIELYTYSSGRSEEDINNQLKTIFKILVPAYQRWKKGKQ